MTVMQIHKKTEALLDPIKEKVKQSRYKPGGAQRVSGS